MATSHDNLNQIGVNFFYRDNNPDCEISRKALYTILNNYLDKIVVQEINFDQNKAICNDFHVYGVPTLLIIKDKKILNRYSGILNPAEIIVFLEPLIGGNQGECIIDDHMT